jgi:hypothetical protein
VNADGNISWQDLEEGREVTEMAVDSAIRNEPRDMERTTRGPKALGDLVQAQAMGKGPVFDRLIDPGDVLIHDATRAQVEVAYLGISHLSFRKPDVTSGTGESRAWILVEQSTEGRHLGEFNSVALARSPLEVGVAPSIQDDEENLRHIERGLLGEDRDVPNLTWASGREVETIRMPPGVSFTYEVASGSMAIPTKPPLESDRAL